MTARGAALEAAVHLTDLLDQKDHTMSMHTRPDDTEAPTLVAVPPLGELLAGDEPDWDNEPAPPIDADQANRYLYRLGQLDRADAADTELANIERARIDLWLSLQTATRQKQRDYLEACLTLMHETHVREGGAKTVHLPNGDLVARKQQPEWVYDDAQFIAWARKNRPTLVRTKYEVDKDAAKKALDPENTVDTLTVGDELYLAPGVTVVKRGDKVTIRPTTQEHR